MFDALMPSTMRGADGTNAGRRGLVPRPAATDNVKLFRGDGTYVTMPVNYLGGKAGNAVPATATTKGDFWIITSAGTSQGKTWVIGDLAVYEGTSGNWTQVTGWVPLATIADALAGTDATKAITSSVMLAATSARRNALAPRGGIYIDGTVNAQAASLLTGQNIGTDGCSLSVVFLAPTANPAAAVGIISISPSQTQPFAVTCLNIRVETNGSLVFRGGNQYALANFVANYGGKMVHVVGTRDAAGNAVLYVNSVSVVTGTLTDNVTSSYLGIGNGASGVPFTGKIAAAAFFNFALSAADVQEIYELGGAIPERFKWATQANAVTNPTAFAGAPWTRNAVTMTDGTGDTTDSDGGNNASKMAVTAGNASHYVAQTGGFTSKKNQYCRLAIRVKKGVGQYFVLANGADTPWHTATFDLNAGTVTNQTNVTAYITALANGWFLCETFFAMQDSASLNIFASLSNSASNTAGPPTWNAAGNEVVYLYKPEIRPVGSIVSISGDDGIGFQLADQSTNKLHAIAAISGVSHVIGKQAGRVRFTTNTNGNQQILGQQALPANARIRSWTIDSAGTPTVKLGNASAGAQFLAAVAIAAGLNDVTLLTRFCSTNNLWVNSTTTDALQHTIDYEIVD